MFVVDTRLANDELFFRHLSARTPAEELPLNWASDDSETEQLISAAQNLLSVANDWPFDNEATLSEVQQNNGPDLAEGTSDEPNKLPVAETGLDDLSSFKPIELTDTPVLHLYPSDYDLQEVNGMWVCKVKQRVIEPYVRHLSEPATYAASSGEPEKLRHQASASANLPPAAVSMDQRIADEGGQIISEVPAESQMSVAASQQQAATLENQKLNVVFWKAQHMPEVPSVDGLPAAEALHQTAPFSNAGSAGCISGPSSTNPNQAGREAIFSGATNPGLPSESLFQLPGWNAVTQQAPASYQGARPKVPTTTAPELSPIPTFVEQRILSDDEEEDVKYDGTSSAIFPGLSQSVPQVIGGDSNGLVDNVISQFPACMITGSPVGDWPMVSNVGLLAELDLRNNQELVSSFVKYWQSRRRTCGLSNAAFWVHFFRDCC